jgi:nitric oxide reductase subunit B
MSGDTQGAWRWKWSLALLNIGVVGMTMALLVSGYDQTFIERAQEGATWAGYFKAQLTTWVQQGMWWRQVFGYVTAAGIVLLVWDLMTIGKHETKEIVEV